MDGRLERALSWMTSPLSRHPAGSDTSPTDLTDTQVAEGEVWESPELLRLIVATLPVGVSVIDRSGNIVLTNAASELIWGDTIVSGEERWARSRAFWHGTSKRIGPSEWASVRCLRDGQTILNELIDIEAFDGRRKTIQNSAVPIRNAAGEIVGSLILNEEVTDRVHAESVLRESADRSQDFSRRLLVVQEEERRHLSRELHDEFERTGIATQVVGEIDDQSGDLAIVCFRAVQEALTNVIRHARAQHVTIELSRAEGLVELTIRDDGVGFDVTKTLDQAAAGGHLGLA
jgi:signal transduction histidine kinase